MQGWSPFSRQLTEGFLAANHTLTNLHQSHEVMLYLKINFSSNKYVWSMPHVKINFWRKWNHVQLLNSMQMYEVIRQKVAIQPSLPSPPLTFFSPCSSFSLFTIDCHRVSSKKCYTQKCWNFLVSWSNSTYFQKVLLHNVFLNKLYFNQSLNFILTIIAQYSFYNGIWLSVNVSL